MDVLAAVLKDLYKFTFVYGFGFRSAPQVSVTQEEESSSKPISTLQKVSLPQLPKTKPVGLLPEVPMAPTAEHQERIRFESIGYAYTPEALLYALPTRSFDGVITRIPYGASFQILGTQGKWCNVAYDDVRGWIHQDDVSESNSDLQPQFLSGEIYVGEHPTTVRLRTVIDDVFHGAVLDVPLQDVEYVTYRIKRKGRTIAWPRTRPRIAGTWQRILKGVRGIHMGVQPKTGSVMEYVDAGNTGHVAYVDSVYPDGGLTISLIGDPTEGVYVERTLGKDEWKELRPIFIEVT